MKRKRQDWVARLFIGTLVVVSIVLGVVQYRWIGEVSVAERDRLRATLQASLNRLSQDFSGEVTAAAAALLPELGSTSDDIMAGYAERYENWRESNSLGGLFRTIALAVPEAETVRFYRFHDGKFVPAEWPDDWADVRRELVDRAIDRSGRRRFVHSAEHPMVFDVPFMLRDPERGFREREWLILAMDPEFVRSVLLPEMIKRHLGANYEAEVTLDEKPSQVLMRTGSPIGDSADLTVRLFEPRIDQILRRAGVFRGGGRPPGGGPPDRGRWILAVRHREGSLEAVVERGRTRNIAVFTALLGLLAAAMAALVRYTRHAQRLADLQMEFVASVSHELRTPLSVMRTAGHNLQGRVATDPTRVKTYGALVEEQAGKLTAIVDQVLSFSNANAGRVIGARVPLEVAGIIQEALEGPLANVEKHLSDNLPLVAGDPTTLRHAIRNLVDNAVKYGREKVSIAAAESGDQIEIRVEDHGPGIPSDELAHLFDPFYRGKKAIEDQIHGTGLGLCLTKRIVEAHDGTIRVHSALGKGTQFIVRLPAVRPETA